MVKDVIVASFLQKWVTLFARLFSFLFFPLGQIKNHGLLAKSAFRLASLYSPSLCIPTIPHASSAGPESPSASASPVGVPRTPVDGACQILPC